jgi:hypothetical protein
MRQYESPNPGDFATAVFGDGPITGVEVGSRDSNSGKIYTWADSVKSGVNQVMSKLIPYHFNPTLLTNKTSLVEIRKVDKKFAEGHHSYYARSENYIYCKDCLNNSPNADEFSCCVIAIVSPYKGKGEDKNESKQGEDDIEPKHALLQVDAIFPHSSECQLAPSQRRNSIMDKTKGGSGWFKFSFPTSEIIRDTYKNQMDKLSSIPEDGEHFGMSIFILCNILTMYHASSHHVSSYLYT